MHGRENDMIKCPEDRKYTKSNCNKIRRQTEEAGRENRRRNRVQGRVGSEKARVRESESEKEREGGKTDSWLLKSTAEIKLYNSEGALILN